MSLTPEQIDVIANEYLVGVFQEMEQDVISDIARRVRKTGRLTETAELMAQSMANQGFSPAEIRIQVMQALNADSKLQAAIAKNTLEYKKAVAERIDQLVKEAQEAGDELVAHAGRMCFNDDLLLWREAGKELSNTALPQIIAAIQAQTRGYMQNLTQTTALALRDASGAQVGILDGYKRFLDKTTLQVATGAFSYDEAVNRTIKEMAKSGIRYVEYNSVNGRVTMTELDVATRRAVRTGVSQMAGRIMEENVKNSDTDLVITSQHTGSRPEHAEWQNKVFSLAGKDKRYKTLADGTGYGTVTGLKGANCTHNFYPYWPGISVKEPDIVEPPPVKVNGREYTYYQATQKQREYERKLRAAKREIAIQEQSGGKPEDIAQLKREARALSKEYNSFSNSVGIRPKPNRARVVGVDRGGVTTATDNTVQHTLKKSMSNYSEFRDKYVSKLRKNGDLTLSDGEIAELESRLRDMFDRNDYYINCGSGNLMSILTDGFKPQQQVLAEGGEISRSLARRGANIDRDLYGTPVDTPPDQRCVFGSLGSKDWQTRENSSSCGLYGNVSVRLKKSGLDGKMTWTSSDSMDIRKAKSGIAGLVESDRVDFVGFSRFDTIVGDKTQNLYKNFYDHIRQADGDTLGDADKFIADYWRGIRPKTALKHTEYMELQFHTDIGIDSIESICAPQSAYTDEVVSLLKSHGIPMYVREFDRKTDKWVVTKLGG